MHAQPFSEEARKLGFALLALFAAMQVAFYKESPFVVGRVALALFVLYALTGYCLLYYWREKIGFLERVLGGSMVSLGLYIAFSYYLGLLFGVHVLIATILYPLLVFAGFIMGLLLHRRHGKHAPA